MNFKISVKASDVFLAVAAYTQLAEVCDHPLHIGITEAGGKRTGTVKSAIGLGNLLWAGIGDTVRVSLSAEPAEEVHVGWEILKSLGIRHRGVKIISCPSCARQGFDVIRTVAALEERLAHIETPVTLSIIGCVVNGPGEALMTDLGVTGGGNGRHMVYAQGGPITRCRAATWSTTSWSWLSARWRRSRKARLRRGRRLEIREDQGSALGRLRPQAPDLHGAGGRVV